jgi:hypothetical protein
MPSGSIRTCSPAAEDLDDPTGFSERRKLAEASDTEVDDALQKLLNGGFDSPAEREAEKSGAAETTEGGDGDTDKTDGDEDGDAPKS